MKSSTRYLPTRVIPAAMLAALTLMFALSVAQAGPVRTGDEPWYRRVSADDRKQAQALFAKAVNKHQQLMRVEALALYEQALRLWDNPDIQWNLALVLEDLGQYLRAYQQLDSAHRWEDALGAWLLDEVSDRMRKLETQRLARIETDREEPAAVITLDGKLWPPGAGHRSMWVLPGEHYIATRKSGYFPMTQTVYVKAGQQARVPLPMDKGRLIETRRWAAWKPWAVIGVGVAVAAVGAGFESRAFANREVAREAFAVLGARNPVASALYDRANVESRVAFSAFIAGGAAVISGLALAWLNHPRTHRTEMRVLPSIELTPVLSLQRTEISALVRF